MEENTKEETIEESTSQNQDKTQNTSTDNKAAELLGETLRETFQRNQELERELADARRVAAEAAAPKPKERVDPDSAEFLSEPAKHTRDIVADEISRAVAPLNDFTANIQRQSDYVAIKQQFIGNPSYFKYLQYLGSELDKAVLGNPKEEISIGNVSRHLNALIGALAVNRPDIYAKINEPPKNDNNRDDNVEDTDKVAGSIPAKPVEGKKVPAQAHLRPSAAPKAGGKEDNSYEARAAKYPWTENQKRLMREWGMTPAQFLEHMETPTLKLEKKAGK